MDDDEFSRLQSIVAANPRGRTPLFRWLLDHHAETAALIRRFGKNWVAIAAGLNEIGIATRNQKPVTAEPARRTWNAVDRYEAAHKRDRAAVATRLPPASVAPPENPAPEPKFKFASMRNGGRGVSAEELRALGDPSAPADPNDPRWRPPPSQKP